MVVVKRTIGSVLLDFTITQHFQSLSITRRFHYSAFRIIGKSRYLTFPLLDVSAWPLHRPPNSACLKINFPYFWKAERIQTTGRSIKCASVSISTAWGLFEWCNLDYFSVIRIDFGATLYVEWLWQTSKYFGTLHVTGLTAALRLWFDTSGVVHRN
jgi:hypothetical protein